MAWIPNVNPNELVASAWGNTIRDHVVNVFASAAERAAAIPTPFEGMTTYRTDTDAHEVWSGTAWRPLGTVVNSVGNTQAVRLRSGSFVGTTDGGGLVGMGLNPALSAGGVLAIMGTVSDDQAPFIPMPIRGHFIAGATVAQWHIVNPSGGNFANAPVRFDYLIVEAM